MSAKLFTKEEAQAAKFTLLEEGKGNQAVHDLVIAYRANRRSGTANTKTRSEVIGSTKKIYGQKGTGNARHGDRKAPIFVGGGVAFGPKPRSYAKTVNKKTRKLALARVLTNLIEAGTLKQVAEFKVTDGKTKSFLSQIQEISSAKKVLLISDSFDEVTYRAARNVGHVLLMTPQQVNIEEMLHADEVVLVGNSAEIIIARTAI